MKLSQNEEYIFKIKNALQSRKLQTILLFQGYRWVGGTAIEHTDKSFIIANPDKHMTFAATDEKFEEYDRIPLDTDMFLQLKTSRIVKVLPLKSIYGNFKQCLIGDKLLSVKELKEIIETMEKLT